MRCLPSLLVAALLAAAPAASQDRPALTGAVVDSAGVGLPGANVTLLTLDSQLVGFAVAGTDGQFRVLARAAGPHLLQVSFVGFDSRRVPVEVAPEGADVGAVMLAESTGELGQLVVEGRRGPVVVRADTLDYDAAAYGAPTGGTAEDLLRRLPGVEVDADGTVRAQGEVVRRILVDGEELFGDAPTVTTRNLPADAIDRVQVFEGAADLADLVGVADGTGIRTINLSLKEDRRGRTFGTVEGGAGLSEGEGLDAARMEGRTALHRLGEGTRASLVASANNVNRAALSFEEYVSLMGGIETLASGVGSVISLEGLPVQDAKGRTSAGIAGVSLARSLGPETRLQANYFGVETRAREDRLALRSQPTGAAGAFTEEEEAQAESRIALHRATVRVDHQPDADQALRARAGLAVGGSGRDEDVRRVRRTAAGTLSGASAFDAAGRTVRADASVTYRRRLPGRRVLGLEVDAEIDDAEMDTDRTAPDGLGGTSTESLRRRSGESAGSARATFAQPLGASRSLQLTAEGRVSEARRTLLGTSAADAVTRAARLAVTLRDTWRGFQVSAGLGVESATRTGSAAGASLDDVWTRLLPSASIQSGGDASRTFGATYLADVRPPTLAQLDPALEAQGPFLAYRGNPGLATTTSHLLTAHYRRFDTFTLTTAFATVYASYVPDAVSADRALADGLSQTITPVNLGGAWTLGGTTTLSRPFDALAGSLGLTATASAQGGTQRLDGAERAYTTSHATADLSYATDRNAPIDVRAGLKMGLRAAQFEGSDDQAYGVVAPYAEVSRRLGSGWEARSTARYERTLGGALDAPDAPSWTAELLREFAGGRARVHLVAADVLDSALDVSIQASSAYIEEERTRSLGRYGLVRFVYNLAP